ncbi:MAG TPA: hypothetical protein VF112_07890 [Candidatus Dormibacteraeota bacterium]
MATKKPTKSRTASDKPAKAAGAKPRAQGGGRRRAAPDADAELLAQLLELQERTAAVGRQIRAVSELVSAVTREATVTAAEVIEQMGAAVDAESPTPPPVAARPRRKRS